MIAVGIFGKRLKQIRTARGLSQKTIAENAGITAAQVSRYEAGLQSPTEDAIRRIAQFLEVSADYLLGLTDDPAPKGKEFNLADYMPFDIKEAPHALRQLAQQLQSWAERLEKAMGGDIE